MIDCKQIIDERISEDDDGERETHHGGAQKDRIERRSELESEKERSRSHGSDTILQYELQ
ncbi:hypothetical protein DY000_02019538 [Brassica cretica]|uniref:Uncharacterized protein n=1 Tax=Brassica cretica TaxID=69181 RepID=A0ABQ7CYU7_BRACR|nr:hypothetical protein DY000_02019538 [Brassica cretica]